MDVELLGLVIDALCTKDGDGIDGDHAEMIAAVYELIEDTRETEYQRGYKVGLDEGFVNGVNADLPSKADIAIAARAITEHTEQETE